MDWFMEYIKNMVIFMLVVTMVLNVYPKSEFEKYIKLFVGLLLFVLMIQPLLQMGGQKFSIEDYLGEVHVDAVMNLQEESEEIESRIIQRMEEENEDF